MAISKKFFVDIDLQGNGLNNSTIGANSEINSKAGAFQYNTLTNRLEYYNGSVKEEVANLNDITSIIGALVFQGTVNCAGATPDPDITSDASVLTGQFWIVSGAGTFLGEAVQNGDLIIANIDNPGATLANWSIVQGNTVIATEEVAGITYLASAAQVATGTETGAYAVNPATLQGKIAAQSYRTELESGAWTLVDGVYEATVTHNIEGTSYPVVTFTDENGRTVECVYEAITGTTLKVYSNILPSVIGVSLSAATVYGH